MAELRGYGFSTSGFDAGSAAFIILAAWPRALHRLPKARVLARFLSSEVPLLSLTASRGKAPMFASLMLAFVRGRGGITLQLVLNPTSVRGLSG